MQTVKIKDKKTGAVKTVKKSLASDYIGTGKFELHKEVKKTPAPKFNLNKDKEEVQ
jgi:hypothetical protein